MCQKSPVGVQLDWDLVIVKARPVDLFPIFFLSLVELVDILVKGALTFVHDVKHQRRGKRAIALVHHCITNWKNVSYWLVKTETGLFWPHNGPPDSCIQAVIKAL